MEMNYKSLGKCIKIARIKADMTQDRLSTMLDMSPSHMSNIETGSTRISLTALVNIANALGVTVISMVLTAGGGTSFPAPVGFPIETTKAAQG